MMTDLRFDDSPVRPARRGSIFRRDRQNGKIFGVCAGMADALDIAHVDMPFKPEKLWKIIHQQ